jgi:serine/threonine-protein kinase RsbW
VAIQRAGPDRDPTARSPGPDAIAPASLSLSLPATAESVGRLRREIAEFARSHGATDRSLESLNLAVSEAVTNVVVHAYREADTPGPILVVAAASEYTLIVTVEDEGCGMTPRADSPGLGLGLGLMSRLADTFEIGPRAARSGMTLRMAFPLAV